VLNEICSPLIERALLYFYVLRDRHGILGRFPNLPAGIVIFFCSVLISWICASGRQNARGLGAAVLHMRFPQNFLAVFVESHVPQPDTGHELLRTVQHPVSPKD